MATSGPKPIPNEIKKRVGTYRPDRHGPGGMVTMTQPGEIPEPPASLGVIGRRNWERIYAHATWVHHETDRLAVELLCACFDERQVIAAQLEGDPENWRTRAALRALDKSIIDQMGTLGLNPADRTRQGFAVVKTASKLEEFLERAAREREERLARPEIDRGTRPEEIAQNSDAG